MAENKFYTRTKTIDGVEYTAQYQGLRAAIRLVDECHLGLESQSIEKMNDYVLKNCIVKPAGLSMESFDDMETLSEVVAFGIEVAQGNFRNEGESK